MERLASGLRTSSRPSSSRAQTDSFTSASSRPRTGRPSRRTSCRTRAPPTSMRATYTAHQRRTGPELGAVRVDQLDPDERQQAEGGRPVAQPLRGSRRARGRGLHLAGEPADRGVDRADRADRPPDRAEEEGGDRQADPPPDVEHPEDRVGEQVLAEDRGEGAEAEERRGRSCAWRRASRSRRSGPRAGPGRGAPAPDRSAAVVPRACARPARARRTRRPAPPRLRRSPARAAGAGPSLRRCRAGGSRRERASSAHFELDDDHVEVVGLDIDDAGLVDRLDLDASRCPRRTRASARGRCARGSRRARRR